jgi:hypothetical protein
MSEKFLKRGEGRPGSHKWWTKVLLEGKWTVVQNNGKEFKGVPTIERLKE